MLFALGEDATIKTRLMAIYFVVNLLSMAIIFFIIVAYDYYSFRNSLVQNINIQANIIETNMASALSSNNRQKAEAILSALQFSSQIDRAEILLADGRRFAQYSKDGSPSHDDAYTRKDWRHIVLKHPIVLDNKVIATLLIHASLNRLYVSLLLFALITALAGILALSGAYILSRRISFGISQPLQDLTQLMRQIIHSQDFTVRSKITSDNEIGLLAGGLNDMLEHIEKRDAALASELEQRKAVEQSLDQLAHYDNVTQLPNRHFFNTYLQAAIDQAEGSNLVLGVMFIDLDNFKIVNDTLGHQSGDLLLKEASQRIQQTLGEHEKIFRIGGDEFAIVIKNTHALDHAVAQAEAVAKEVIRVLHLAFDLHNNEIYVGASIGISFFPTQASDLSSLLSNADAAMYHAKSLGKNNFQHYHVDMEGRIRRRLNMENSLRRAIDADELELYYQLQVEVDTLRIVGFEALLRWHHPKMGTITPSEFIPLAEESGLILQIGGWVMVTACYQVQRWQKVLGPDVRIAVNFTARQLKDEAMVEKVLHALAITGLPAHTLDLELTESSLMDNSDLSIGKMNELRRCGINISIDDFGTGFSSLSYLKRFPLNALKIDRSFISDIPGDEDDVAITNAIIALANTLKIEVVAEGVETREQLDYLRENNCRLAQGNFLSIPLPARKMEDFLYSLEKPMHLNLPD